MISLYSIYFPAHPSRSAYLFTFFNILKKAHIKREQSTKLRVDYIHLP